MTSSISSELEDLTICPICLNKKTEPKKLECQHSYCSPCLEQLVLDESIACPECRSISVLPESGIQGLPADFITNKLMSALSQQSTEMCANCQTTKVQLLCRTCNDYFCKACGSAHKEIQVFQDHIFVLAEKCLAHPRKDRIYLCIDCQEVICSVCVMENHQKHLVEDVKIQIDVRQRLLLSLLQKMDVAFMQKVTKKSKGINIPRVTVDVQKRITVIQKQVNDAAACHIQRIKEDQSKLQEDLDASLKDYEKWVSEYEETKLFQSKIKKMRSGSKPYLDNKVPAGAEVLDMVTALASQVQEFIDQMNDIQLTSYSTLKLPKGFSHSTQPYSIGSVVYLDSPEASVATSSEEKKVSSHAISNEQPSSRMPSSMSSLKQKGDTTMSQNLSRALVLESSGYDSPKTDVWTTEGKASFYSDSHQIYVGNIPVAIGHDGIKKYFEFFGEIARVWISKKPESSVQFGFITFERIEVAQAVLRTNVIFLPSGQRLIVSEKRSKSGSTASNERPQRSDETAGSMQRGGEARDRKQPNRGTKKKMKPNFFTQNKK